MSQHAVLFGVCRPSTFPVELSSSRASTMVQKSLTCSTTLSPPSSSSLLLGVGGSVESILRLGVLRFSTGLGLRRGSKMCGEY